MISGKFEAMSWLDKSGIRVVCLITAIVLIVVWPGLAGAAEETNLYAIEELPVATDDDAQIMADVAGDRVVWLDATGLTSYVTIKGYYDLQQGKRINLFVESPASGAPPRLAGDWLVYGSNVPGGVGLRGYNFATGQHIRIASAANKVGYFDVDGDWVVWEDSRHGINEIYAFNLVTNKEVRITNDSAEQSRPVVSDGRVVWLDARNRRPSSARYDIYGYDLNASQEFVVATGDARREPPDISGDYVAWVQSSPDDSYATRSLRLYSLGAKVESRLLTVQNEGIDAPAISGSLLVWRQDKQVLGFDLAKGQQFIISRAIGDKLQPRIDGNTVVWADGRNNGIGKYSRNFDIYAARLKPGPAPLPPIYGALASVDARIQVVWPFNKPVLEADRANVLVYLFRPGSLATVACQWEPVVRLWAAINNEPARLVATGVKRPDYSEGRMVPSWQFDGVDVSAARDPLNKIYFFVTVDGVAARSNVWSHGMDGRTYFPVQETPTGVGQAGAVDAKIQIVWPHGGGPANSADKANISVRLFQRGSNRSVPADWSRPVTLLRSLNDGVAEEVGKGVKRVEAGGGVQTPVWDFNDVPASAALDQANRYYFRVQVDGVDFRSNVWSHGVDARTYFPHKDVPTNDCR